MPSLYVNVTDPRFFMTVETFLNIPKGGRIEYGVHNIGEGLREIVQEGCPSVVVDCNDPYKLQEVIIDNPNCTSLVLRCGHEQIQVFNWDLITDLPSQLMNSTTSGLSDAVEAAGNGLDVISSSVYDAIKSTTDTLVTTPYKLAENMVSNFTGRVSELFYGSSRNLSEYGHAWAEYFGELIYGRPEIQCNWDDLTCHQEALSQRLEECTQEDKLEYLKCCLAEVIDYVDDFDMNEILQDIQENYLPTLEASPANIAIAATVVAAAACGAYAGIKYLAPGKKAAVE